MLDKMMKIRVLERRKVLSKAPPHTLQVFPLYLEAKASRSRALDHSCPSSAVLETV